MEASSIADFENVSLLSEPSSSRSSRALLERAKTLASLFRPTPLIPLQLEGVKLYAKLEYLNPVGSLKDRTAFEILRQAIRRGDVTEETTLVESSSGNFATALAVFSKFLDLEFIPVIDPNITPVTERFLRRLCTRVIKVDRPDDTGGYLKSRLQVVEDLRTSHPNCHWTNQYGNPDGMRAHYNTTGVEICDVLPSLDYVFLGVSTGGTIAGISRRVKEKFPLARVVAVDAEGSVIFGGPPKKRCIPGLGASIRPDLLTHAIIDDVIVVREGDSVRACHELLRKHGLFVGGSTGTVFSAIQQYFAKHPPNRRVTALFLCADRGTAYIDTVYSHEWAQQLD